MENSTEASFTADSLIQDSRLHLETAVSFANQKMSKTSLSYAAKAARLLLEAYYMKERNALPLKGPGYEAALLQTASDNGQLPLTDELLLRTVWYVSEHYDYVLPHSPKPGQILNLLAKLTGLQERIEAALSREKIHLRSRPSS
ncbi:hypothetical protein [Gorillibacterium timonense]|uniref:hypothetical protein n=1 Tax=Gorillibacterium timonense TaxID=1689269 RepID=UPI00071C49A3|nr:hypothetical protein [Gorillibacterium timonense]